jgi:hypothetical protein
VLASSEYNNLDAQVTKQMQYMNDIISFHQKFFKKRIKYKTVDDNISIIIKNVYIKKLIMCTYKNNDFVTKIKIICKDFDDNLNEYC